VSLVGRECEELALVEDRHDKCYVIEVGSVGVRYVHDDYVPVFEAFWSKLLQRVLHSDVEDSEEAWDPVGLGNQSTFRICDAAGVVENFVDYGALACSSEGCKGFFCC
jgi:hypothetical protein